MDALGEVAQLAERLHTWMEHGALDPLVGGNCPSRKCWPALGSAKLQLTLVVLELV